MSDISFREFYLADEPCHICGEDEISSLAFTITEDTDDDDYFETDLFICRDCLESLMEKHDDLVEEFEFEESIDDETMIELAE